jgi:chemotaxis protein MotB
MALSRRSGRRFEANIWPGFVDALTALLLVLVFIISIFMIVQFMLRDTIETQGSELDELAGSLNILAVQLGLEQQRGSNLEDQVSRLGGLVQESSNEITRQRTLIASLVGKAKDQKAMITSFEEKIVALLSEKKDLSIELRSLKEGLSDTNLALNNEISEKEIAMIALAKAREEIDQNLETARLAAARREAMEALIASIRVKNVDQGTKISELEKQRLVDTAALQNLKSKLENGNSELTAMSLALEEKRKEAEATLTLLAAANSVKEDLNKRLLSAVSETNIIKTSSSIKIMDLTKQLEALLIERLKDQNKLEQAMTEAERQEILLSVAKSELINEKDLNLESKLAIEALNQQVAEVRLQLGQLQSLLDASEIKDIENDVQVTNLTNKLNAALARVAAEQRRNSKELKEKNKALAALVLQRDIALENLKTEKDVIVELKKDETIKSETLKKQNAELQTLATERDKALEILTKEQKRLSEFERKERERLEAEAKELKKYQSKFFAEVEKALGDQEGVIVKGDRFIFSSEILFDQGQANISSQGFDQIRRLSEIIQSISKKIPPEVDWILRVDGHTDNIPLRVGAVHKDNWELSQARALSVVRYMSEELGVDAKKLAATGFGEYRPVDTRNTKVARAKNRRIEIKLTEH